MRGILLLFVLLSFASACGGGGEGDGAIRVNLTVEVRDNFNQPASGRSIKITDNSSGSSFQCSQQGSSQGISDDLIRCGQIAAAQGTGTAAIIFKDLPTEHVYTLTEVGSTTGVAATCQVNIKDSTSLSTQAPCIRIGLNTVEITLS